MFIPLRVTVLVWSKSELTLQNHNITRAKTGSDSYHMTLCFDWESHNLLFMDIVKILYNG